MKQHLNAFIDVYNNWDRVGRNNGFIISSLILLREHIAKDARLMKA